MHHAAAPLPAILAAATLLVAACATPAPSPEPTPMQAPATPIPTTTLDVSMLGPLWCSTFPNWCSARLSILEPGATVLDSWRPPQTDPWWGGAEDQGMSPDHFTDTPYGTVPLLAAGSHELVVSLIGGTDLVSYNPDGTVSTELLGRCQRTVTIPPVTALLEVRVTFTPEAGSFRATCSIETSIPER